MKNRVKYSMLICFSCRSRSNEMSELIVVTIVVASEGGVKVPKVSSREELKTALNKLGALRSEQVCCGVCCIVHTGFHVLGCLLRCTVLAWSYCPGSYRSSVLTLQGYIIQGGLDC